MLKFENITVCHGNHTVFSEIDFCLRPHRLTAVSYTHLDVYKRQIELVGLIGKLCDS